MYITFSYMAPTAWNNLSYKIRNAPSVTVFRKKLKTLYFKTCSRPPDGSALSGPEVYEDLTLPDMGILTLINVSGFVSPLLKSDTRNKSVQTKSFISFHISNCYVLMVFI